MPNHVMAAAPATTAAELLDQWARAATEALAAAAMVGEPLEQQEPAAAPQIAPHA